MVYNHKLIDAGFFTVRHLFDSNRNFKGLSCPRLLHLWPVDHSLLASLVDAIPEKWRKQLKANGTMTSLNEHCIDCSVSLYLKGRKIYTDKIQSKLLYETLSSQTSSDTTAMKKYNDCSTLRPFNLTWKDCTHYLSKYNNAGHKMKRVSIQNTS